MATRDDPFVEWLAQRLLGHRWLGYTLLAGVSLLVVLAVWVVQIYL